MKSLSAQSCSEKSHSAAEPSRVLIWDLPTRLFHWLLVTAFALAWLSAESESWREIHAASGIVAAGLVAFRLAWGVVGSRHARFANFVRAPCAALAYLRGLLRGQPRHYPGHNPAGGWVILGLLLLVVLSSATGWLGYGEEDSLAGELHEGLTGVLMMLAAVHLAGVAIGSIVHGENLARAMVTGMKRAAADDALRHASRWAALLLIAWVAMLPWAVRWL
jgi:cytochrome b